MPGARLGHRGKECSFASILSEYGLADDRALALLGRIVTGADTDVTQWNQPEGPGLKTIAEGFQLLVLRDDHG